MRIHLIAVGTRMPGWVAGGFEDYARRLPRECSLVLHPLEASIRGRVLPADRLREAEGERLLAAVPTGCRVIALDERGDTWTTADLVQHLANWLSGGTDVALLVGGAEGLDRACLEHRGGSPVPSSPSLRVGARRQALGPPGTGMTDPGSPVLYLASQSPRRRELLSQVGLRFEVVPVEVDETPQPGEMPADLVQRLAREKAVAGLARLPARAPGPVLGADTEVVIDNEVLGKPRDEEDAAAMLARLSGRSHHVLSAVALAVPGRDAAVRLSTSTVWFRVTTTEERLAYCATGEPLDKAGSYAIQGLAAVFVSRLEGSYSGVMGLPLFETAELLEELGIRVMG